MLGGGSKLDREYSAETTARNQFLRNQKVRDGYLSRRRANIYFEFAIEALVLAAAVVIGFWLYASSRLSEPALGAYLVLPGLGLVSLVSRAAAISLRGISEQD